METEERVKATKKDVLVQITNIAKQSGLTTLIGEEYWDVADDIALHVEGLKDAVKKDNRYGARRRDITVALWIRRRLWGNDITDIVKFNDFDHLTMTLLDKNYIDLAEKIETILIRSGISNDLDVVVRKYWKCEYCGTLNVSETECDKCGASRKLG